MKKNPLDTLEKGNRELFKREEKSILRAYSHQKIVKAKGKRSNNKQIRSEDKHQRNFSLSLGVNGPEG